MGGLILLYVIEISMYENALLIGGSYDLEDAVVDQLVFIMYRVFIRDNGNAV